MVDEDLIVFCGGLHPKSSEGLRLSFRVFFWESYEQEAIILIFHSSEFVQFFQIKF